uniref:PIPK domain-containing protein n=1 Tax=Ananas comosus var. bracteatus TaxID=296719 RepID=A0A6V7Q6P6_ANACO|nr:unnamed protein product [Ananas comosus var. bracteatus]
MKLHRLERIARCLGSPIISFADVLMKPKLNKCDFFHIEKFVEDHDSSEVGKRPSKTLIFFEGFPKPLGCTILLRGENSEELKKIKRVMHYTVFAAYHLILETSFFADQRVFLTDKNANKEENSVRSKTKPFVASDVAPIPDVSGPEGSTGIDASVHGLDIPISNGTLTKYTNGETLLNSYSHLEVSAVNSDNCLAGKSIGHGDVVDSSLPLKCEPLPSSVSETLKSFYGGHFCFDVLGAKTVDIPVPSSPKTSVHPEGTCKTSQEKLDDESCIINKDESITSKKEGQQSDVIRNSENQSADCSVKVRSNDEIVNILDPKSIVLLTSSQSIKKEAVCEQGQFSRINYYGFFDMSLGRYFRDILLNQKHICSSCGDPPEAHVYSYTHRNGNITVLVNQLPPEKCLSGERDGKIWMWTRCLRCEPQSMMKTSPRVSFSTESLSLSFGKFLELGFSSHFAAIKLKCGHSLHRDCLRFFGLGSKVAMFRYSSVEIYAACKPPATLEFHNPNRQEWLIEEARYVRDRGNLLFMKVAEKLEEFNSLLSTESTFSAHAEDFSEVTELLMKEKIEFEASVLKVVDYSGKSGTTVDELLDLNLLYQDLLLELYVWDRRLNQLLLCKQVKQGDAALTSKSSIDNKISEDIPQVPEDSNHASVDVDEPSYSGINYVQDKQDKLGMALPEVIEDMSSKIFPANGISHSSDGSISEENVATGSDKDDQEVCMPVIDRNMQVGNSIQVIGESFLGNSTGLEVKTNDSFNDGGTNSLELKKEHGFLHDLKCRCEDTDRWIWAPFSESRLVYQKELQFGSSYKFNLINSYCPSHLPPVWQNSPEETNLMQFTIGPGGNVLSISEDEVSSIIAHALAISEDRRHFLDAVVDKEAGEGKEEFMSALEKSRSFSSESSGNSSYWSSTGSFDFEGNQLFSSFSSGSYSFSSSSSDELNSGSDSSSLLVSNELHPEIRINGKVVLKSKYTVTCICAKEFYNLRKKCCPSELAYISSLSRCKKWDAQGGKSKAFFAKTMDDRFIIKQIKKTEFESFLKFALITSSMFLIRWTPEAKHALLKYLEYISELTSDYTVVLFFCQANQNGKEIRIDLMVMENLLFGRNVSRTYDLKGAVFSRHVSDSKGTGKVLLDQNFVEDMRLSPIYVGGKNKHLLQRAIWNDTAFLTSINVMDYSLLVGVDKQRHELVFGIIDYLRQYTWDKQLETWVKASLVVPKNVSPTVITPKEYRIRFRKFVTKYFLIVPDALSSEPCVVPCKFCTHGNSKLPRELDNKQMEQPIEACA